VSRASAIVQRSHGFHVVTTAIFRNCPRSAPLFRVLATDWLQGRRDDRGHHSHEHEFTREFARMRSCRPSRDRIRTPRRFYGKNAVLATRRRKKRRSWGTSCPRRCRAVCRRRGLAKAAQRYQGGDLGINWGNQGRSVVQRRSLRERATAQTVNIRAIPPSDCSLPTPFRLFASSQSLARSRPYNHRIRRRIAAARRARNPGPENPRFQNFKGVPT